MEVLPIIRNEDDIRTRITVIEVGVKKKKKKRTEQNLHVKEIIEGFFHKCRPVVHFWKAVTESVSPFLN